MKENIIKDKSFKFAVRIVSLYKLLCNEKKVYVLSKQIIKSCTSIVANAEEADGGISKPDFSNKTSIAYKESKETHYWLLLLRETNYLDEKIYNSLISDCDEICRILFSILKTTRINK